MRILKPISSNADKGSTNFRSIKEVIKKLDNIVVMQELTIDSLDKLVLNLELINNLLATLSTSFSSNKEYKNTKSRALDLRNQTNNQIFSVLKKHSTRLNKRNPFISEFLEVVDSKKYCIRLNGVQYMYFNYRTLIDINDYTYNNYWFCLINNPNKKYCSLACLPMFVPPNKISSDIPVKDMEDVYFVLQQNEFIRA